MSEKDNTHVTPQIGGKHFENVLSDAPVKEVKLENGLIIRLDQQGRLLCHAKRRDGEKCKAPVITGMRVCRKHGGRAKQARRANKERLAELASPMITVLAKIGADENAKHGDRLRAADSILDRAGYGRQHKIENSEARDLLKRKLMELRDEKLAGKDAEILEDIDEELEEDGDN